jgi:hypothetical protein
LAAPSGFGPIGANITIGGKSATQANRTRSARLTRAHRDAGAVV